MIGKRAVMEIRMLHRHGKGMREIARETGSSRNTVRRYLRDESATRYRARPMRVTKLDPFKGYMGSRHRTGARFALNRKALKIGANSPSLGLVPNKLPIICRDARLRKINGLRSGEKS
jgi:transposase